MSGTCGPDSDRVGKQDKGETARESGEANR